MTIGPGKYDDVCTTARIAAGVDDRPAGQPGGVVLIVLGGKHGQGFSVQCDLPTMAMLPDILQHIVDQMRADMGNVGQ